MKILGLIPARGGSKGIYQKNIAPLFEKPLICWSIREALESFYLTDVYVSSDSTEILEIARGSGAKTLYRPSQYAKDDSPPIDAIQHALRAIPYKYDRVCLLQPTSPLRRTEDINAACIASVPGKTVVSVTVNTDYPFIIKPTIFKTYKRPNSVKKYLRRQEIKPRYFINGAIYVSSVKTIFENNSLYTNKLIPYIMKKERSYQIDTQDDFDYLNYVFKKNSLERPTYTMASGYSMERINCD